MFESADRKDGWKNFICRKVIALPASVLLFAVLLVSPAISSAAITVETLAGGSCGQGASCTTVSFTPAANALVLALVGNGATTSVIPDGVPSVAGSRFTWEMVQAEGQTATLPYSLTTAPKLRVSLFRAMPATTASETLSITFVAEQKNCAYSIIQIKGIDVSGTNGSAAILQLHPTAANSTVGWSVSIHSIANAAANLTMGAFGINQQQSSNLVPGTGYTASELVTAGNPNIALRFQWAISASLPVSTKVDFTSNASIDVGGFGLEIKGGPTPILGDGADPPPATLSPGGAASMADSFTFHTPEGASAITGLNVTLSPGSYTGLSRIEITDDSGSTVYGYVSNPASDTVSIPLSTNIIATTTVTSYKIRVTPKTHDTMPAPQGTSYQVSAWVSNWAEGSDPASTIVTIDNRSPDNVTNPTTGFGDAEVTVGWTAPADTDLAGFVVLRKAASTFTEVPAEGTTYTVGNTIGTSTVACVVAKPGVSCIDNGLVNNTPYYYKIFARDSSGNYSAIGTTAGPCTPNRFQPDVMIKLSGVSESYLTDNTYELPATTQVKPQGVKTGSTASYSVRVQNDGTGTDSLVMTGTATGSGFTVLYKDDAGVDRTDAVTHGGYTIPAAAIGAYKDWTVTVTPTGGTTPVPGGTVYDVAVTATSASDSGKVDQVKASTSSISANITLSKTTDKPAYKPGELVTYTISASNGVNLSDATAVSLSEAIPPETSFKVGGATFNAGSSTLTSTISYLYGVNAYTPVSGGCGAAEGYDDCVTQVKWVMTGRMPAATSFTCQVVVRVR